MQYSAFKGRFTTWGLENAKITELISSNDGTIWAAKVLLPTKKVLNRPLNLLYPFECDSGRKIEMTQDEEQSKKLRKLPRTLCVPLERQQLEQENRCKNSFLPK